MGDLITDTTDISIDRGFDVRQGVVGTPIAGVLEANIVDPSLDGIETQKVAVGQRVRLRRVVRLSLVVSQPCEVTTTP